MKLIYLASPYSDHNKVLQRFRELRVTKVAAKLTLKYGYAMFLPITQSAPMVRAEPELGGSFKAWKKIDLFMIKKCDELWVVKLIGWNESIGVRAEIRCAKRNKKPIKYINPSDMEMTNEAY